MTTSRPIRPTDPPTTPVRGCPFLGLREDAQTRFSTASPSNYCHRVKRAEPVDIVHQNSYCLSEQFSSCKVFAAAGGRSLPVEARLQEKPAPASREKKAQELPPERPTRAASQPRSRDRLDQEQDRTAARRADDTETWARLHNEALNRYEEIPANKGKHIWTIVFIAAVVVLVAGIIGVYSRLGQIRTHNDLVYLTAQAAAQGTAVAQAQLAIDATATAFYQILLAPTATPTPTEIVAAVVTEEPLPSGPTATPTNAGPPLDPLNCMDERNFGIEIISGPNLMPAPGSRFVLGQGEPTVQASWTIKNTGTCAWKEVVIKNLVFEEKVTPLLRYDGKNLFLEGNTTNQIPSGAELELVVGYRAENARNIDRKYSFLINSLDLPDLPHLEIQVTDWVFGVYATSTPNEPRRNRPTSQGGGEQPPNTRP